MAPSRGRPLVGRIAVPGDKSITHRRLIVGALGPGPTTIPGANVGADVRSTCGILSALGAPSAVRPSTGEAKVEGCGWDGLTEPEAVLDAGNSGTTLRTMLGVCSALPFGVALTGDWTLRRRPMGRVVEPLRRMGAHIDGRRGGELPPLWVRGGGLRGADVVLPLPSAQVKTALLLAGLRAEGVTTVTEPAPSRDHTERMLAAAGAEMDRSGNRVSLSGGQALGLVTGRVPGDLSSAMFLVVAACLMPGSRLTIERVGLNPTRTSALKILDRMAASIEVVEHGTEGGEPFGAITASASHLEGTMVDGSASPGLLDEVPVLAVAASQARGDTTFVGMAELRVKESDRIEAILDGLVALGGEGRALGRDGFVVRGPTPLRGGAVDARGDHRIALAFSVAGLVSEAPVTVRGWDCVATSFPEWTHILAAAQGDP